MKAAIVYHSQTGNTKTMAEVIAEGMNTVAGVEAKTFPIDAVDEDWMKESQCVIMGSPSYYADVSGAMKTFLETCGKYGLAGKLGGAFATANYIHGGGEIVMQTIMTHMHVFGMMTYSGGGSYGKPVIHLGPVAVAGKLDESKGTFHLYGQRMATQAAKLFN